MATTNLSLSVTNVDRRNGKHKKSIWIEPTETFPFDVYKDRDGNPVPSRYGPSREYVANCTSVEAADLIVELWNSRFDDA